jgi:DNA-binding CsgD family transcriptional regulator
MTASLLTQLARPTVVEVGVAAPWPDQDELTVKPQRRSSRDPSFGWESLTVTELRVIRLVAVGRTNRQVAQALYLSHHTVDFHLRQIFRKLGIGSRVQLAGLAFRHGVAS